MLLLEGPREAAAPQLTGSDLDFHELADSMHFYLKRCGQRLHGSNDPVDTQLFECLESALFIADDYIRECAELYTAHNVTSDIREALADMRKSGADEVSVDFATAALKLAERVEVRVKDKIEPSTELLEAWAFTPKTVSAPRHRAMTAPGKPGYIPR